MKTLTLNFPDTIDIDNNEVAMLVAARLYEQGKLSLGQAAEVAGLTKRVFAELYRDVFATWFLRLLSALETLK